MLESDADRLAELSALGGELAQINDRDVLVLFTDEHAPLSFGNFVVDGSTPQVLARASDISDVDDNSTIVVRSISYRVGAIEPDGVNGMTVIRLRKL